MADGVGSRAAGGSPEAGGHRLSRGVRPGRPSSDKYSEELQFADEWHSGVSLPIKAHCGYPMSVDKALGLSVIRGQPCFLIEQRVAGQKPPHDDRARRKNWLADDNEMRRTQDLQRKKTSIKRRLTGCRDQGAVRGHYRLMNIVHYCH